MMPKPVVPHPFEVFAKLNAEQLALQERRYLEQCTGMSRMRLGTPSVTTLRFSCRNCGAPGEPVCSYCGTKP